MPADDREDGLRKNVTTANSEAIYRSPPGRSIVTPETPFGQIDRERDTAVRLWRQLGLPLRQDGPAKPKSKASAPPPRTSLERRIDRGKRGVLKGNMLANRIFHSNFMSRVGDATEIDKIVNAVKRINSRQLHNINIDVDRITSFTLLGKRQLMIANSVGERKEKDFLVSVINQIDRTSKMLEMLSTNSTLRGLFDIFFANHIVSNLRDAKINILFEAEEFKLSEMKKLLYFGSSSEIAYLSLGFLANSAKELLRDIENVGKIVEYAQYKFVDDLTQIWLAHTGNMPETERWSPPTDDDGLSSIDDFTKFVHVLEPKISAEIIRTVVDAFKSEREESL